MTESVFPNLCELIDDDSERLRSHARLLSHSLEKGLKGVIAAMLVDLGRSGNFYPGITGDLIEFLGKPTSGKLLNFARKVIQKSDFATDVGCSLSGYFMEHEAKGAGFLSQLVQLRNRWAHPQDETSEQVLKRVAQLVSEAPAALVSCRLEVDEHGDVTFVDGENHRLRLQPFAYQMHNKVELYTAFDPSNRCLLFERMPVHATENFAEWWVKARNLDRALTEPTAEEVFRRAKLNQYVGGGSPPWWMKHIFKPGAPAMLLHPKQIHAVLPELKRYMPGGVVIHLNVEEGQTIEQRMAKALGLAAPPTSRDLQRWSTQVQTLVVAVNLTGQSAQGFLAQLYWLTDLCNEGKTEQLRILFGRSEEELKSDEERLWDRLPGDLDRLVRVPSGVRYLGLASLLWPLHRPRRMFGLF